MSSLCIDFFAFLTSRLLRAGAADIVLYSPQCVPGTVAYECQSGRAVRDCSVHLLRYVIRSIHLPKYIIFSSEPR